MRSINDLFSSELQDDDQIVVNGGFDSTVMSGSGCGSECHGNWGIVCGNKCNLPKPPIATPIKE